MANANSTHCTPDKIFALDCVPFQYTHNHVGKVIARAVTVFSLGTVYG